MHNQAKVWSVSGGVLLAISFVAFWVWPKFVVGDIHPIFGWMEARTGASWLDPTGRYIFAGLAAVLAAMLLIRPVRFAGAVGALVLSLAVAIAHATPWLGWNIPNYDVLTQALAAGRAVAEIEALGLKGDRGAHLSLALVNASLAALVMFSELSRKAPKPKRQYTPFQFAA